MAERSTKPYLIRAIHEWCSESSLTPYISVKVDDNTRVPPEHVKNGEIVLTCECTHFLRRRMADLLTPRAGRSPLRTETPARHRCGTRTVGDRFARSTP